MSVTNDQLVDPRQEFRGQVVPHTVNDLETRAGNVARRIDSGFDQSQRVALTRNGEIKIVNPKGVELDMTRNLKYIRDLIAEQNKGGAKKRA